jgi:hypothetical protein
MPPKLLHSIHVWLKSFTASKKARIEQLADIDTFAVVGASTASNGLLGFVREKSTCIYVASNHMKFD